MLRNRQWEIAAAMPVATFGQVDRGGYGGRGEAGAEQDARTRGPESHAEGAVDQRRAEAGERDEQEVLHNEPNLSVA